jgi:hypothetical protein
MNTVALVIGYGVMACAGVALLACLVWLTTEFAWTQIKRVRGTGFALKALRTAIQNEGPK